MRKAPRHSLLFLLPLLAALLCCGSARAQFDEDTTDSMRVETPGVQTFDTTALAAAIHVRSVPDTSLQRLRASDAYWYANTAPERKKQEQRKESSGGLRIGKALSTLIWILIIGTFIGVLIWYLASSEIRLFRKASPPIDMSGSAEDTVEDIFSLDYGKAIARAVAAGDFRLAIRLHYLSTLKDLSNRGLINYTQERTNSEYLQQMAGTPYYRSFFRITRDFEYSWYGGFRITEETYARVQNEFADFKQQLRS